MITVCVQEPHHKERLDIFLSSIEPNSSRSVWQKQIKNQGVFLNFIQTYRSADRVSLGDVVTYDPTFMAPLPQHIIPTSIPLDIVYEDEDLLIINKQAGLVVHPACNHQNDTLVNGLLFLNKPLSDADLIRPGIVHRLDKDTSGLLIVAKNNESHQLLSDLIYERKVKREYDVLVSGIFPHEHFTCETFIKRDKRNRKKMSVSQHDGKLSVTHFKFFKHLSSASWLKAHLQTGRTHQIRVHLKHLGFPVLGDPVYGSPKKDKALLLNIKRQALHASYLSLPHPRTQSVIEFRSDLPTDIIEVLNQLS